MQDVLSCRLKQYLEAHSEGLTAYWCQLSRQFCPDLFATAVLSPGGPPAALRPSLFLLLQKSRLIECCFHNCSKPIVNVQSLEIINLRVGTASCKQTSMKEAVPQAAHNVGSAMHQET